MLRAARVSDTSSSMISTDVFGSSEDVGSSASSSSRPLHDGARDADALALAAGQRVGALVGELREADGVEQLERRVRCPPAGIAAAKP